MRDRLSCASTAALCVAGFVALGSSNASAQAWVPDRGEISAGLDYNLGIATVTETNTVMDFPDSGTTSHQFVLSAEYAPIQRLAVQAQLPFMAIKYTGIDTAAHGPWDDGSTHTTLTDLRAGVRYAVLEDPIAIAPHLAASVPVADYAIAGNTVAGRHVKYLHAGISIGYILADTNYLHALYEFSLGEKADVSADTKKYSQNRSDVGFTAGHVFNSIGLDLHVDLNYRRSHDGVNLDETYFVLLTDDEKINHDVILKEEYLLLGGGVGYNITDSISGTLAVRKYVAGKNTQDSTTIAAGISWSYL